MGLQFDSVTTASDSSLTWIMDDLIVRSGRLPSRRELPAAKAVLEAGDLEAWVNALLRQATPIVASPTGRAHLEAWLAAVDPAAD
jgi:hypothetical protein